MGYRRIPVRKNRREATMRITWGEKGREKNNVYWSAVEDVDCGRRTWGKRSEAHGQSSSCPQDVLARGKKAESQGGASIGATCRSDWPLLLERPDPGNPTYLSLRPTNIGGDSGPGREAKVVLVTQEKRRKNGSVREGRRTNHHSKTITGGYKKGKNSGER